MERYSVHFMEVWQIEQENRDREDWHSHTIFCEWRVNCNDEAENSNGRAKFLNVIS